MAKCDLEIVFEEPDRTYQPGDTIRGFVGVTVNQDCRCRGLTLTRQWKAHGRGNTKRGAKERQHLFEGEWEAGDQHVHPFEFQVPAGPLTYHGHYLNVDWVLSARADIPWAFDPKAEEDVVVVRGDYTGDLDHGPRFSAGAAGSQGDVKWSRVIFGAVFAGFAAFFLFASTCTMGLGGLAEGGWGALSMTPFLLMPLLFMGVGGWMIYGGIRNSLARRRLGDVKVDVQPTAVRSGDEVQVEVAFTPKTTVRANEIRTELSGQEVVVSGSGTNKTTHRHTVASQPAQLAEALEVEAGEPVHLVTTLRVPPDAGPSFRASDNRLDWKVEVHIDVAGWSDFLTSWTLEVTP